MKVVVLGELTQHCCEVARSGDQEVVEALPAQGADEAFRDRVRSRCSNRCADDADVGAGEHGVERGSEFAVPVPNQEPERGGVVAEVMSKLRACWVTQAPVGWAVIRAMCTRRRSCSITTST